MHVLSGPELGGREESIYKAASSVGYGLCL